MKRPSGFISAAIVLLALFAYSGFNARAALAQTVPAKVAIWKVYAPGWNLVAGPAGSRLAMHGEDLLSLDDAQNRWMQTGKPLAQAGEGYWVFYAHGQLLQLVGVPQNVSTVHVDAGHWALLGNSGAKAASVRGADIALTYDPGAGYSLKGVVQPGQAAMVFAYDDADVLLDPYSPPQVVVAPLLVPPSQSAPALPPPFPTTGQATSGAEGQPTELNTPPDELNYLIALSPVLRDLDARLGAFADGLDAADPTRPNDPAWQALRDNAAGVAADLLTLRQTPVPSRYVLVQADLVAAFSDISDGMRETINGLLSGQQDRVTLGAGLLQSGARRLTTARSRLPV